MRTNKSLLKKKRIEKALITLPSLTLLPEDADRFIDYIVDQSVLKNSARIIRMKRSEKVISALGFGTGRFLKSADTFTSSDYKTTFGSDQITLSTVKFRGCVVIRDDDLEDQYVESEDQFTDHLMSIVARKTANELEEIFYIADNHALGGFAADDPRSMLDGWRYILTHAASGETYENQVSGSPVILDASADFDLSAISSEIAVQNTAAPYNWEFKYAKPKKQLPSQYKSPLKDLRFYNSDLVDSDFVEALSARSTVQGDAAIVGGEEFNRFGNISIVPVPLFPTTLDTNGVLGAGVLTDVLLTQKDNLIIGIQRSVKIEAERQAADEANYFFVSLRVDTKIENVNACVLVKNLAR